jgi:hypothetical protein
MKRIIGLSVTVLLFASLAASAQEKTTPYYPLKVGAKWIYKVGGGGGTIEVKVDKKEKFGEEESYKLETSSQGKVSASEHVVVRDDGVYRLGVNGLKASTPIKFLALPPAKGFKWQVKSNVQGQEIEGEFQIQEVDIKVPAGEYKGAILVEGNSFKIAGQDTSIKCWFVKEIGIVKLEFKLGGQDASLELEKFEAGGKGG